MTVRISKTWVHRALPIATLLAAVAAVAGCAGSPAGAGGADGGAGVDARGAPDGAASADAAPGDGTCAPGPAGVPCVMALHDQVAAGCDPTLLAALEAQLDARRGTWPLWHAGRALFASDRPVAVAGDFDGWATDAVVTAPLCGGTLDTAMAPVASGRWPYKLVDQGTWELDPQNWGFAYDDFAGNADGKNSVLDTYDSALGHLVRPPVPVCSTDLGNCRALTAYLPAGYDDPATADRTYPVLFMHDGQNVFDDHTCCFGHTGWEINVQLDGDVAAGLVEPVVVVAADHGGTARIDEYGVVAAAGGEMETFMRFQVETVQPTAAGYWRIDPARAYVAGSSLGGLVSMHLALAYPDVYRGAASLSGSFWEGQDDGTSFGDALAAAGRFPVGIYLDSGGEASDDGDSFNDTAAVRDQMVSLGWARSDSPACQMATDHVCYYWAPGATHDELAWKARAWRFLRFFFGK
jgi:predicted alpha/beta superfamily hydrolase